ncbi:MAG: hypothetical protein LC808_03450 [Actinobacteria bacterium]|nr:hypothetical protein [Actinomycetota bacterium]
MIPAALGPGFAHIKRGRMGGDTPNRSGFTSLDDDSAWTFTVAAPLPFLGRIGIVVASVDL